MYVHTARCLIWLLALSGGINATAALKIAWEKPIDLGPGGYARVHRLADGRFMAAYSAVGGVVARFASQENLREWSEPIAVARDFTATNGKLDPKRGIVYRFAIAPANSFGGHGRAIYSDNYQNANDETTKATRTYRKGKNHGDQD